MGSPLGFVGLLDFIQAPVVPRMVRTGTADAEGGCGLACRDTVAVRGEFGYVGTAGLDDPRGEFSRVLWAHTDSGCMRRQPCGRVRKPCEETRQIVQDLRAID
jgi:hypothetical protein